MSWKLHEVKNVPSVMDEITSLYTVIHRTINGLVRVDVMDESTCHSVDKPVISFQGTGDDVRRAVLQWFDSIGRSISADHAGYIGYEIHRAMVDPDYVQA